MSHFQYLRVIIRLPLTILFEGEALRLNAVSSAGSFGLLPNHVDFVSDLQPSVLSLWNDTGDELLFGIDEGLLVKQRDQVFIVVRRGVQGDCLTTLSGVVQEHFLTIDDEERHARAALARLEANMARRFTLLQRERL